MSAFALSGSAGSHGPSLPRRRRRRHRRAQGHGAGRGGRARHGREPVADPGASPAGDRGAAALAAARVRGRRRGGLRSRDGRHRRPRRERGGGRRMPGARHLGELRRRSRPLRLHPALGAPAGRGDRGRVHRRRQPHHGPARARGAGSAAARRTSRRSRRSWPSVRRALREAGVSLDAERWRQALDGVAPKPRRGGTDDRGARAPQGAARCLTAASYWSVPAPATRSSSRSRGCDGSVAPTWSSTTSSRPPQLLDEAPEDSAQDLRRQVGGAALSRAVGHQRDPDPPRPGGAPRRAAQGRRSFRLRPRR